MNRSVEKRIGQNIRILRESSKLTQEELANNLQLMGCDITRSSLAKIEIGQRHIYPDEIIMMRNILKVTYDEIFDLKQNND